MKNKTLERIKKEVEAYKNSEGDLTFFQNPKLDYLFGIFGGKQVPTKQDKFKPVKVVQINDDKSEEILTNFYVKKPDSDAVREFCTRIKKVASEIFPEEKRIKDPHLVEVVISVTVTQRRFKEVDVDNLAKCVLDSLNQIAYDDDSQVSSLICSKSLHETNLNGVFIGITRLTPERTGFRNDIKLFSLEEWGEV